MVFLLRADNTCRSEIFIYPLYVICSVGVHTASELQEMQERLESSQLKTYNLTKSDLVKDHLRYLVILLLIIVFLCVHVCIYELMFPSQTVWHAMLLDHSNTIQYVEK